MRDSSPMQRGKGKECWPCEGMARPLANVSTFIAMLGLVLKWNNVLESMTRVIRGLPHTAILHWSLPILRRYHSRTEVWDSCLSDAPDVHLCLTNVVPSFSCEGKGGGGAQGIRSYSRHLCGIKPVLAESVTKRKMSNGSTKGGYRNA